MAVMTTTREHKSHARIGRGSVSAGFSLIELLVVIAIIAVLTSIVMASLSTARSRGRDGRRVSDIKQIQLALTLYYDANHAYPTAIYGTQLTGSGFIPTMPKDPMTGYEYAYVALQGPSANNSICASYHLGAKIEQGNTSAGSALNNDSDAVPGGSYGPDTNGPVCANSSWAGNSQIPQVSTVGGYDFSQEDPIYDVRP